MWETHRPAHETCLYAKDGLRQTVAAHDVGEVLQDGVEDLVQLLPHDGQGLLGGELPCERLGLMRHNENPKSRPRWWPPDREKPGAEADPPMRKPHGQCSQDGAQNNILESETGKMDLMCPCVYGFILEGPTERLPCVRPWTRRFGTFVLLARNPQLLPPAHPTPPLVLLHSLMLASPSDLPQPGPRAVSLPGAAELNHKGSSHRRV